jgi:hypothetical protein
VCAAATLVDGLYVDYSDDGVWVPVSDPLPDPIDPGGSDPGAGVDPGDPGSGGGFDPGTDPGSDPGSDPGTDPGSDPGSDPGDDSTDVHHRLKRHTLSPTALACVACTEVCVMTDGVTEVAATASGTSMTDACSAAVKFIRARGEGTVRACTQHAPR